MDFNNVSPQLCQGTPKQSFKAIKSIHSIHTTANKHLHKQGIKEWINESKKLYWRTIMYANYTNKQQQLNPFKVNL